MQRKEVTSIHYTINLTNRAAVSSLRWNAIKFRAYLAIARLAALDLIESLST